MLRFDINWRLYKDNIMQSSQKQPSDGSDLFYPSTFDYHEDEINFLKEQGFATNPYNSAGKEVDDIWQFQDTISQKREDLAYPIDGVVVKLNDNKLASKLGVVGKTPRAWCAIKFKAEEVVTRIVNITWQVGRTGRLTPVAELEAVDLAGTTVKRATLHNYKEVLDKNLHYHDTVVVHKAGDIIPEVLQVLVQLRPPKYDGNNLSINHDGQFTIPKRCPSCTHELILSDTEVDLICRNIDTCPDQIINRLSYYTARNNANIIGLSDKIILRFIKEFGVHDIADLYDLPWDKIQTMEGFGEKSVNNLKQSVENSKQLPDYKFLAGLGIDGIGQEVAKLICEKIYDKNNKNQTS